jgi:hypothetical protein
LTSLFTVGIFPLILPYHALTSLLLFPDKNCLDTRQHWDIAPDVSF